jgi:hypothetical protein
LLVTTTRSYPLSVGLGWLMDAAITRIGDRSF